MAENKEENVIEVEKVQEEKDTKANVEETVVQKENTVSTQQSQSNATQQTYVQPNYSQPNYVQPNYNQPNYGQPNYGQQNYNQPNYGQPNYNQPNYNQQYNIPNQGLNIPSEYKPIGAWGYVGWQILFSIPLAGLILLIVFACGASSNKNLTNFARSYFCWLLIALIIIAIIIIFSLVGIGIFNSSLNSVW